MTDKQKEYQKSNERPWPRLDRSEKLDTTSRLRERTKELNCLYGLSRLEENHPGNMDAIFEGLVKLLPQAWQYSDIAAARIILGDNIFQTANYKRSKWRLSAQILSAGKKAGAIEVCYLERVEDGNEGPFLREERMLINTLALHIQRIIGQHQSSKQLALALKQLELERNSLSESNTAMRVMVSHLENERHAVSQEIAANIERSIAPILKTLQTEAPEQLKPYLNLLERSLQEIGAPFVSLLTQKFSRLSPAEVAICNMIRTGLSSKEIAQLRHISPITVARHRESIRKKVGISNTATNLTTFLQQMELKQS